MLVSMKNNGDTQGEYSFNSDHTLDDVFESIVRKLLPIKESFICIAHLNELFVLILVQLTCKRI